MTKDFFRPCLVEGCANHIVSGHICSMHWFKLPMKFRQRWWQETDYAKNPPSAMLAQEMQDLLRQPADKSLLDVSAEK